jgi:hypothetical protein
MPHPLTERVDLGADASSGLATPRRAVEQPLR